MSLIPKEGTQHLTLFFDPEGGDSTLDTILDIRTKATNKPTSHEDDKITTKKNEIDVKITYFNKRETEKRVRGVILSQKLTLNHLSLVDDREESMVLVEKSYFTSKS